MFKQFFTAFLGSMAALWVTIILSSILSMVMMVLMVANMATMSPTVNIQKKSILYLDLSGAITERAKQPSVFEEIYNMSAPSMSLNEILRSIRRAATDNRIEGIYINCGGGSAGIATSDAIINALKKFKESGKWVVAYGDAITQGNYYIACAADSIYVNPVGSVDVHGLSATVMFYKGLLDKLGVEMQVIKVGTFKSAVEPYILTEMSEANRLQQEVYINNIWGYMSGRIASMRSVQEPKVNQWANSLCVVWDPKTYVANHIVDGLKYRHSVDSMLAEWTRVDIDDLRLVTPAEYCMAATSGSKGDKKIAVLYAEGDIVDSGEGGIVGDEMAPLILDLADDDDIDGMVLRVNSGGGSAFASEQIWEALEQFKAQGKPLYVSMGDYAASGGYYISCGASRIYAEPTTITGSIGIFGLIPCAKGLFENHLGITSSNVSSNANSDFLSTIAKPLTPMQRNAMQQMINRGYETFVGRCARGRNMPVDSIKAIAEGRVWDGMEAQRLKLVDELGGLDKAITDMGDELGAKDIQVVEYPSLKINWWDELMAMPTIAAEKAAAKEMGDWYPYYKESRRLLEMSPVQCRMQPVTIQ